MQLGTVAIVYPQGYVKLERREDPPGLDELQLLVEGWIELLPQFNRLYGRRCVAYCNEDGRRLQLPENLLATSLWGDQLRKTIVPVLRGTVVVVCGNARFRGEEQ